jgi:putative transposase
VRYAFIKQHSTGNYPVRFLCKICQVSSSGYYEWLNRKESPRTKENRALTVRVRALFAESDSTYGAIRICRELKKQGVNCSKNRIARIMRHENLVSVHRKKFRPCTTNSKHRLPVAPNVISQDFSASAPNEKWGGDITYIPTAEGFVYLAVILDFFSRKIVGRAIGDSLHATLCCDALKMALLRRQPPKNLVHHSDRGVQYASAAYTKIIHENNFTQSMSRTGNCYDNAMVESFFHSLKVERVNRRNYQTKKEALIDITDYIENWYNQKRSHSSLDYVSPTEYESQYQLAA